jgi:hypothetical protein
MFRSRGTRTAWAATNTIRTFPRGERNRYATTLCGEGFPKAPWMRAGLARRSRLRPMRPRKGGSRIGGLSWCCPAMPSATAPKLDRRLMRRHIPEISKPYALPSAGRGIIIATRTPACTSPPRFSIRLGCLCLRLRAAAQGLPARMDNSAVTTHSTWRRSNRTTSRP